MFGAAREFSETVSVQHDTEVALSYSPVVPASETVEDPSTGQVYEYGADYVVRGNAGTVEALSTGDLSDGQSVEVAYAYKLQGEYTKQGVSDPRSQRFDVNIPTERGCGQAALYLVEQLGEPVVEAEIVVPKQALGWDAINALTVPGLPGERHQVKTIEESPQEIRASLASRESVGDVVDDLRREVTGNTRRT